MRVDQVIENFGFQSLLLSGQTAQLLVLESREAFSNVARGDRAASSSCSENINRCLKCRLPQKSIDFEFQLMALATRLFHESL